MSFEARNESDVRGEESMFSRQKYIDNVLASAMTYQDDDSTRILCRYCGEEQPDWDLPTGYDQPPHMPDGLCVPC